MKTSKKIICLVLTFLMAFSVCVPAFAADNDNGVGVTNVKTFNDVADTVYDSADCLDADGDHGELAANIILPGISQSISTLVDENGDPILDGSGKKLSGGLLIIDTTDLAKKIIKNLAWPLISTILTQKTNKNLASGLDKTIKELFSVQAMNDDGTPVNNFAVDTYNYPLSKFDADSYSWFYRMFPMQPLINKLNEAYGVNGEDYIYLYTFPLLGDPMAAGAGLSSFIEMVKKQTGCRKVNLISISMGGTVMTSYMEYVKNHGGDYSNINKLINVVACLNGTDIIGDVLSGNLKDDDEFWYNDFIPAVFDESANGKKYLGYIVNYLIRFLPKDTYKLIVKTAIESLNDTLLAKDPQLWALCPSDRYDECAEKNLSDPSLAELKAKTDAFQQARLDLKDNLIAARNQGVKVYSAAGYDRTYFEGDYNFFGNVKSSDTTSSDSVIDVDSTTLGATYAPAGTELSSDYINSLSTKKYLSPDKNVDASTCLFSDTTWFFKGQHHEVGRDDVVIRLLANIAVGNIDDVNSDPNFPQFNGNRNTKSLTKPGMTLDNARDVLRDSSKYNADDIAEIQKYYDEACALLKNTVMADGEEDRVKEIQKNLKNALAAVGAETAEKDDKTTEKLNKFFSKQNDKVMKRVGAQGFSDVKKGKIGC